MALSNWLTRDEWNACWVLGLEKIIDDEIEEYGLGKQLRLGIATLHKLGYKFTGIADITEDGNFTKVSMCCTGNETVLGELIDGTFNKLGRSREALAFFEKELPEYDASWLKYATTGIKG